MVKTAKIEICYLHVGRTIFLDSRVTSYYVIGQYQLLAFLICVTLRKWPIVQNTGGTSKHYTSQQQGFIKQQQAQATRNSGTK